MTTETQTEHQPIRRGTVWRDARGRIAIVETVSHGRVRYRRDPESEMLVVKRETFLTRYEELLS